MKPEETRVGFGAAVAEHNRSRKDIAQDLLYIDEKSPFIHLCGPTGKMEISQDMAYTMVEKSPHRNNIPRTMFPIWWNDFCFRVSGFDDKGPELWIWKKSQKYWLVSRKGES